MHRARAIVAALFLTATAACTQAGSTPPPTSGTVAHPVSTTSPASSSSTSTSESESARILRSAERFIAELNRSLQSRDTVKFRGTFLSICLVCIADADRIDGFAKAGQTVEGGQVDFTGTKVVDIQGEDALVTGELTSNAATIFDTNHKTVESFPKTTNPKKFALKKVGDQWLLQAIFD